MTPTSIPGAALGLLPVWPAVVVFAVLIVAAVGLILTLIIGSKR